MTLHSRSRGFRAPADGSRAIRFIQDVPSATHADQVSQAPGSAVGAARERMNRPYNPFVVLLLAFIVNATVQAAGLVWLHADCESNPLLVGRGIFYFPLSAAVLQVLVVLGYLTLTRRPRTLRGDRVAAWGIMATTLIVLGACGIEACI